MGTSCIEPSRCQKNGSSKILSDRIDGRVEADFEDGLLFPVGLGHTVVGERLNPQCLGEGNLLLVVEANAGEDEDTPLVEQGAEVLRVLPLSRVSGSASIAVPTSGLFVREWCPKVVERTVAQRTHRPHPTGVGFCICSNFTL